MVAARGPRAPPSFSYQDPCGASRVINWRPVWVGVPRPRLWRQILGQMRRFPTRPVFPHRFFHTGFSTPVLMPHPRTHRICDVPVHRMCRSHSSRDGVEFLSVRSVMGASVRRVSRGSGGLPTWGRATKNLTCAPDGTSGAMTRTPLRPALRTTSWRRGCGALERVALAWRRSSRSWRRTRPRREWKRARSAGRAARRGRRASQIFSLC